MSILILSVGGRERIVSNYTRTDSAPSSTGTLTDLRYERLETTLSLSLSLSPANNKNYNTENSAQDEFTHTPYSLLNSEHVKKRESFITPGGAAAAEAIFEMTIVETRHCTVFVRGSLDKSFAIPKTSNIPYLIICLIFVHNI